MTTQAEVVKSNHVVQTPMVIRTTIWTLLLTVLLIGAIILTMPRKGEDFSSSRRALDADSARYQGLADAYAALKAPVGSHALEAWAARYQGQADAYAALNKPAGSDALEAWAARYQGQADAYAEIWSTIAARYQAMADYYQAKNR